MNSLYREEPRTLQDQIDSLTPVVRPMSGHGGS
jgi:hypothetical protein